MKISKNYKQNLEKLENQSAKHTQELNNIARHAIAKYTGQIPTLETAIGMLFIGDHFGWRALSIIHSKRTIRKYEQILDIKIKDFFPEETKTSDRSIGYATSKKISNFWKAVSGEIKIDKKQEIE